MRRKAPSIACAVKQGNVVAPRKLELNQMFASAIVHSSKASMQILTIAPSSVIGKMMKTYEDCDQFDSELSFAKSHK